jgi:hypothetical protein
MNSLQMTPRQFKAFYRNKLDEQRRHSGDMIGYELDYLNAMLELINNYTKRTIALRAYLSYNDEVNAFNRTNFQLKHKRTLSEFFDIVEVETDKVVEMVAQFEKKYYKHMC